MGAIVLAHAAGRPSRVRSCAELDPAGATAICRAEITRSARKPGGTFLAAEAGFGTMREKLNAERVACGAGKSILRRTSGASMHQSPKADFPESVVGLPPSAGDCATASEPRDASNTHAAAGKNNEECTCLGPATRRFMNALRHRRLSLMLDQRGSRSDALFGNGRGCPSCLLGIRRTNARRPLALPAAASDGGPGHH